MSCLLCQIDARRLRKLDEDGVDDVDERLAAYFVVGQAAEGADLCMAHAMRLVHGLALVGELTGHPLDAKRIRAIANVHLVPPDGDQ